MQVTYDAQEMTYESILIPLFCQLWRKTILFRKKEPILGTVKFNAEINAVKGEGKDLRDEVAKLKKRSDEITKELTKDR